MRNKPATDTFEGEYTSNPMSNSTQNKCPFCKSELVSLILPSNPPQYKTYCPNCEKYKVSNSTQNDEIGKMEKAIDEGFAESERDLKNRQAPLDTSTQNNHETHTACIERIKKEGASATCCHCNPHDGCTLEMKPTQNDWYDHAVKNPGFKSGLNALKNDTQNDWDGELYKVACHIHAESMAYKGGMAGADDPEMSIYKRLKELLADARREGHELGRSESVEFEVDKERKEERERIADLIDFAREDVCFEHKCVSSKEAFLATLREEEKHG